MRTTQNFTRTLALCDAGLVLGAETCLAAFAEVRLTKSGVVANHLRLDVDAERLTGLLATTFGHLPSQRTLSAIETAATHWHRGDKALANLRLVFAGLPILDAPEDVYRLKAAELLFDAGLTADDLAAQLGADISDLGKYDPNQPRVPAGEGRQSGRWAAIWSRFRAWLDEEVPEYDQDTGDVVGTRSRARAIATNPLTILGAGAAVIAAGEVLVPAAAAGAVADAGAAGAAAVAPVAEDAEALTPFAQRYLSTSGGRLGSARTRQQLYEIARGYVKSGKYEKYYGDGEGSEEYIQGRGPGTKGSTYVDFTAKAVDGETVRIQTVNTLADGVTPTQSEMAAAARIKAVRPNDKLILIPKQRP